MPVLINALFFRNNISIFNIHLPFKEWYGLTVSNTMYNYLLPARGGLAIRAIYLKNNYHFPFSQYLSYLTGTYLLQLFFSAFWATLIGLYLFYIQKFGSFVLIYSCLGAMVCFSGLMIFLYKINPINWSENNRLFSFIRHAAIGTNLFKENPSKVLKLALLHIFFILAISLRLFIAYYVLDIHLSFLRIVFIICIVSVSMVLSITPGNLGIKEGIIGLSANILGLPLDQALLGAVLDRIVAMILVFLLGVIFSRVLIRELKI